MKTVKTLTDEECSKLLRYLQGEPVTIAKEKICIRNHTMALLMLDAGLRVGEVVGLRRSNLMFKSDPAEAVCVPASVAKNHKERFVPMTRALSVAICRMRDIVWVPWLTHFDPMAFNSPRRISGFSTRQVERIINDAAIVSLGKEVHPHVLRHTFATRMLKFTNIRIVQQLLGHSSIATTQIYTHPNSNDLKEAIENLNHSA